MASVLDVFAPAKRHRHDRSDEYRRVVDALEGRGMDYRVAVELADPASRCTEGPETPSYGRNSVCLLL
jgi:hypothetical protein